MSDREPFLRGQVQSERIRFLNVVAVPDKPRVTLEKSGVATVTRGLFTDRISCGGMPRNLTCLSFRCPNQRLTDSISRAGR